MEEQYRDQINIHLARLRDIKSKYARLSDYVLPVGERPGTSNKLGDFQKELGFWKGSFDTYSRLIGQWIGWYQRDHEDKSLEKIIEHLQAAANALDKMMDTNIKLLKQGRRDQIQDMSNDITSLLSRMEKFIQEGRLAKAQPNGQTLAEVDENWDNDTGSRTIPTDVTRLMDLKSLAHHLGQEKEPFILKCHSDVESYVSGQGKDALGIIEKGVKTHKPAADSYAKVLWHFCKRKPYHDNELQSVLCSPISKLVMENFKTFFLEQQDAIKWQMTKEMLGKVEVHDALAKSIYDELGKKGIKKGRKNIAMDLGRSCHSALQARIGEAGTANDIQAAPGSTLATSISNSLVVAISHKFDGEITKLPASAAFHAVLKTTIGRSLHALVTTFMVKIITTTVGAGAGSALLGSVAWTVGSGFVLQRVLTIPHKLDEALGKAIGDEVQHHFEPWTQFALQMLLKESFDIQPLLEAVVKSELDQMETTKLEKALGLSGDDDEIKELTKNVNELAGKLKKSRLQYRKSGELRLERHSGSNGSWIKNRRRSSLSNSLTLSDLKYIDTDWTEASTPSKSSQGSSGNTLHSDVHYFSSA